MAVFMNYKRMREKAASKQNNTHATVSPHINDVEDGVKVWTVGIDGETTNIVLHRDTMEVTCNGKVVESSIRDSDSGDMTVNFKVANKEAQITNKEGSYTLTVNGRYVPSPDLDLDLDERF